MDTTVKNMLSLPLIELNSLLRRSNHRIDLKNNKIYCELMRNGGGRYKMSNIEIERKFEIVFEKILEYVKDPDEANEILMRYEEEVMVCETKEELEKMGGKINENERNRTK